MPHPPIIQKSLLFSLFAFSQKCGENGPGLDFQRNNVVYSHNKATPGHLDSFNLLKVGEHYAEDHNSGRQGHLSWDHT